MAYLEHDDQGLPLVVSWKKSENPSIEISQDIAIGFMEGKLSLHDYKVSNGELVESAHFAQRRARKGSVFWALKTLDDRQAPASISIDEQGLFVEIETLPTQGYLYATLKDDPSWLIRSWSLSGLRYAENQAYIDWPDAGRYSYYIGMSR